MPLVLMPLIPEDVSLTPATPMPLLLLPSTPLLLSLLPVTPALLSLTPYTPLPLLLSPWTPSLLSLKPTTPYEVWLSPITPYPDLLLPSTPSSLSLTPSTAMPPLLPPEIAIPLETSTLRAPLTVTSSEVMVTSVAVWVMTELPIVCGPFQRGMVPGVPLPVTFWACREKTADINSGMCSSNDDTVFIQCLLC